MSRPNDRLRVKQSRADLIEHLSGQMRSLARDCEAYDHGDRYAATGIARTIRLLVHDTRISKSLLDQLGALNRLFVDGAVAPPPAREGGSRFLPGLCMVRMDGSSIQYVPTAEKLPPTRKLGFKAWWTNPVTVLPKGLSRREIVLAVADTDGGAHVDADLDDWYEGIRTGLGLPVTANGQPLAGFPPAALRQIAHEMRLTLEGRLSPQP